MWPAGAFGDRKGKPNCDAPIKKVPRDGVGAPFLIRLIRSADFLLAPPVPYIPLACCPEQNPWRKKKSARTRRVGKAANRR